MTFTCFYIHKSVKGKWTLQRDIFIIILFQNHYSYSMLNSLLLVPLIIKIENIVHEKVW